MRGGGGGGGGGGWGGGGSRAKRTYLNYRKTDKCENFNS